MTNSRPRCGNDPRTKLTDGARQAVDEARAYLAQRKADVPLADQLRAAISRRGGHVESTLRDVLAIVQPELDRLRAELALATVFEIPRPEIAAPLQVRQIYDGIDRWAICDRTGRRWGRDGGWWYEPPREDRCDDTRFTLAEALPLAQKLAAEHNSASPAPSAEGR